MEKFNKKPIHISEGYALCDGMRIYDAVKLKITVTPKVLSNRVLGDKTPNTRLGNTYDIAVEMTRRRSTNWTLNVLKKYLSNGITPEFTFVGVMNDKDSDFYDAYGETTVTVVGCVPTSPLDVLNLDADGEYFDEALTFAAKDIIIK